MWSIQIRWIHDWVTLRSGFKSRDAAEWEAGKWKQLNNCVGDPFRFVEDGGATVAPLAEPSFVTETRDGKLHFDDAADALYRAGKCIAEFTRDERGVPPLTDAEAIFAVGHEIIGDVLVRCFPRPDGLVRYMLFRVEGEQSRPPTGSAGSTEPTSIPTRDDEYTPTGGEPGPDDVPAPPRKCMECHTNDARSPASAFCESCWANIDKVIPF